MRFAIISFIVVLGAFPLAAKADVLTVTTTNDSGAGSLRQAILDSNASTGVRDTIAFDIAGAGPHVIQPASVLPTITDPVTIDGTTEPDFVSTPIVVLDGQGAANINGLTITASDCVVRGLVIERFGISSGSAIMLSGNGANNNVIQGNFLGTDETGQLDRGNRDAGVTLRDGSPNGPSNNLIGGTNPGEGNVLSGNSGDGIEISAFAVNNRVEGNFIGTNLGGTAAIPNGRFGVYIFNADDNTIGGTDSGARNIISGNANEGVFIDNFMTGTVVQGNFIGTDITGTVALPNQGNGVQIQTASQITIGGGAPEARNIISGNAENGVQISGSETENDFVQGNFIGTDVTGALALGNTKSGVKISGGAKGMHIGGTNASEGNLIAFNLENGVAVDGTLSLGSRSIENSILSNSIFQNTLLGIDLQNTGNDDQAPPVLTSSVSNGCETTTEGTLASAPNTDFLVQFFSNPAANPDEGKTFLGSVTVTTDGSGNAAFNGLVPTAVAEALVVTATATNQTTGDTSEFSAGVPVTGASANPGTLQFKTATFSVAEDGGSIAINVTRTAGTDCVVSVDFATADGTASDGLDYTASSGTLTWESGDDSEKTFNVPILADDLSEADETVDLALSNPSGGATLGSPSESTLTIVNVTNDGNTTGGGTGGGGGNGGGGCSLIGSRGLPDSEAGR